MLQDDDIVCTGWKAATAVTNPVTGQPAIVSDSDHALIPPPTAIVLHVDDTRHHDDLAPSTNLHFRKSNASVIQIGRRSGLQTVRDDPNSAMFRCAVVSRKHAKIAFSDGGQAYLYDLNSHHGTFLRKAGEATSRKLTPETSTLLSDGDIITLGKPVGKGEDTVNPVVLRVELQTTFNTPIFTKPIIPVISSPSSSEKSRSSGRYGVHDFSSSSSDESSSAYSDIEEISPPIKDGHALSASFAGVTGVSVFKRLMNKLPSVNDILDRRASFFDLTDQPESMPTSPHLFPVSQVDARPESYRPSRSHSPMDLGSPSPQAEAASPLLVQIDPEMPIISSINCSPVAPVLAIEPSTSSAAESNFFVHLPPIEPVPALDLSHAIAVSPPPPPPAEPPSQTSQSLAEILDKIKQLEETVNALQIARRKYKTRFNNNVSYVSQKLSEYNDKLAEVDAEYRVLSDQVEGVQHGDLPELLSQIEDLQDRIDEVEGDMRDRQESDNFSPAPTPPADTVEEYKSIIEEMKTLKGEMEKELQGIRTLREEAEADIAKAKADALAILSSTTAAAVAVAADKVRTLEPFETVEADFNNLPSHSAHQTATPTVLTSLKRKRDDTDENGEVVVEDGMSVADVADGDALRCDNMRGVIESSMSMSDAMGEDEDMVMDDAAATSTRSYRSIVEPTASARLEEPPRKRARRGVGSVIAQTATAVTIGAVVTWSALAFC